MKPFITLLLCLVCVPAFAQVDAENAPLWASVMLVNDSFGPQRDRQGSGTIVSPEGLGVTCGHLFAGRIGGTFKCFVPASETEFTECQATLLYHDGASDVAVFSIPKEFVRGYCPVTHDPPKGRVRAVGYPEGAGPTEVDSGFIGHSQRLPGRWAFAQYINNGQSGGGIFQGGYLVGVMTNKSQTAQEVQREQMTGQNIAGQVCLATSLPTIEDALAQCGPNGCSPGGSVLNARPNRRMGTAPIGGGQIPPPAPRDDGIPPVDINDLPCPEPDAPTPIVPKPVPQKPVTQIPVEQKPIKGDKGDPGVAGKDGAPGRDGKDADEQAIVKLLIERLQSQPIKFDLVKPGPDGKPQRYRQQTTLGGEPIELQLTPKNVK